MYFYQRSLMLLIRFQWIAASLLLAASTQAAAGALSNVVTDFQKARSEGKASTLLDIDNDSLLLTDKDGFYTSGLRLTRQYALRDASSLTVFGWRLGQELYTTSDINIPPEQVGPPDHPYAGWLYIGVFREQHHSDGRREKFGLDVGCLGPCAGGKRTQTFLHDVLDQPPPRGWSTQMKNEAGAVLYADVSPVRWTLSQNSELTPNWHVRFGNIYTDAGAGLTLRAGRLDTLPDQSTLHALLRMDGRLVGYNASLQGGYFSSQNIFTEKPKRFVGEAELGVVWRNGPYGITASIVRRGNEIQALPNAVGAQNFARLQFSYAL
jgi:lipid A 3-O-deacylase